jgi:predicted small secreted protein
MRSLLLLSLASCALLLSACNTIRGVGEDISGSATWTQEKMTGESSAAVKSSDADYVQNPPQFPKSSN